MYEHNNFKSCNNNSCRYQAEWENIGVNLLSLRHLTNMVHIDF